MKFFRNVRNLGRTVSDEAARKIRIIKTSENSWQLVWADEVVS